MPLLPPEPYLFPDGLLDDGVPSPPGQWWVLHTRPRQDADPLEGLGRAPAPAERIDHPSSLPAPAAAITRGPPPPSTGGRRHHHPAAAAAMASSRRLSTWSTIP